MRRRDFLKSLGFICFGEISAKTGTKNNQIDSEISSLNKTIEFVSQQKIQKSTGKVITVLGEVLPIDLGGVLIHEHLLTKINNEYQLNDRNDAITKIKVFGDYDLKLASNQKNHTVVDVTTFGIRLPFHHQELKEISESTGINVVMGTGYYLPDWNLGIERWSVDQLANEMLNESTLS